MSEYTLINQANGITIENLPDILPCAVWYDNPLTPGRPTLMGLFPDKLDAMAYMTIRRSGYVVADINGNVICRSNNRNIYQTNSDAYPYRVWAVNRFNIDLREELIAVFKHREYAEWFVDEQFERGLDFAVFDTSLNRIYPVDNSF